MHLYLLNALTWFDNRTLFSCQCLLVVMFAVVFLWMRRQYPRMRGVGSMLYANLLGIPCTLLLIERGTLRSFWTVVVANTLALGGYWFLYDGVVRFVGGRRRAWLLGGASAVALLVVAYASEVEAAIVPRIVALGLVGAMFQGVTGWELLRRARRLANRATMRFYGGFLLMLAIETLHRVWATVVYGTPEDFMRRDAVQTSTILLNVLYIGVSGLCFVLMANQEMMTRGQVELERDALSGVLNRRGIEERLGRALTRCERAAQHLSVALVDLDHFKEINDSLGHGPGDAAIRQVAQGLAGSLRDVDSVGRYGGDEFLLVLPVTAYSNALIVVERLCGAVSGTGLGTGQDVRRQVTLSVGVTEAGPGDDVASVVARAVAALDEAKRAGRNCMRLEMPARTFGEVAGTDPLERVVPMVGFSGRA